MSDTSQGPGWWQASDGKWYSPELYPKDWDVPGDAAADVAAGSREATEAPDALPASTDVPDAQVDQTVGSASGLGSALGEEPKATVAQSMPTAEPEAPAIPISETAAPGPSWEAPSAAAEGSPPAASLPDASTVPPSGWSPPDPAAADPTLVEGMAPVSTGQPTTVQPAVAPPASPPPATGPTDWSAPSAPVAPPTTWDSPSPGAPGAAALRADMQRGGSEDAADVPGGLLALLGGAGLIIGSFLDWAVAGGTLISGSVNGLTGSNGWGTLIAGLVVATCGGALLAGQRKSWVAGIMALAALVGLGLAIFSYVDIGNTSDDLSALLRSAEPPVADEVADGAVLDYDLGMWLVLAGGVVSLLAAGVAFVRRR